jgi:transposase
MANLGRKTKLTPEVEEKIVSAIRAGNYAQVAAEYAGISKRTFYNWLQWGQEGRRRPYVHFLHAVKTAEREAEGRAVAIVQKHMADNWQAAMTYLERKHPERWGRRDRLKIDIDPRQALADLLALSDDDLDAAIDHAARQR